MPRNNQRRTSKATSTPEPKQAPASAVASPLDFVTPTEFVDLPSQGKYYAVGHPLHNQDTVEIRFMTARDEDILTSQTLIKKGMAIEKFMSNILVDKSIDTSSLLVGDRNAILVAARITGYGPEYKTAVTCPSCKTRVTHIFDLNERVVHNGSLTEEATLTGNGTFITQLPLTKVNAELKVLNGADESAIVAAETDNSNTLETSLSSQIGRCIVSINGDASQDLKDQFLELMPAYDARHIRRVLKSVTPMLDLTQDFKCTNCGLEQRMEVPFTAEFFWPE